MGDDGAVSGLNPTHCTVEAEASMWPYLPWILRRWMDDSRGAGDVAGQRVMITVGSVGSDLRGPHDGSRCPTLAPRPIRP